MMMMMGEEAEEEEAVVVHLLLTSFLSFLFLFLTCEKYEAVLII